MIYVDASQLARFLRAEKPVTGIQRLTLNSLTGLAQVLGEGVVRALVYDAAIKGFRALTVPALFAGAAGEPAQFTHDDHILLMEWFWDQQVFEAALVAGKAEGAKQFRFLHDVIPVARPDFVRPDNARRFRTNAARAIAAADVLLTNSDYSAADIVRHFPDAAAKPLQVLKLPHEFAVIGKGGVVMKVGRDTAIDAGSVRPAIARLRGSDFALMVGTLEERKNTLLAVKAWARLARKCGARMPKLVLVGFYSAHSLPYTAALVLRIKTSRTILHFSDCSDAELAFLYQHCRFSLYISQYEGWGLPIGESLWFGKRVLTQDVTSLREAGGDAAHYVDANDPAALDAAIQTLCDGEAAPPERSALRRFEDFSKALANAMKS